MKKLLLILGVVVVLLIITGFLLPSKIEVSKSISINAPVSYAFEEINALENWPRWSYWNTLDTAMQVMYGEVKTGTGANYSWTSEELGDGSIIIAESIPNKLVRCDLSFMENGVANASYDFASEGQTTKLTMKFFNELGYNPVARWFGAVLIKPELEKAFDYNLEKIKTLAESKPIFQIEIMETEYASTTYIGLSHYMSSKNLDDISAQMSKMYAELFGVVLKAKSQPSGYPFCIYPNLGSEATEMICALPVSENVKLPAKYKLERLAGGKAVKGIHKGDYNTLGTSHADINRYIASKGIALSGAPWEVYVTDPELEKDTTKWITEIYYPVKRN